MTYLPLKRPTGEWLIIFGVMGAFVGLVLLLFGLITPAQNPSKWPLTWGGIAVVHLSFALWFLGQVQKALWFLPGQESKAPDDDEAPAAQP